MKMKKILASLFKGVGLDHGKGLGDVDAKVMVTIQCLVALCDEVLTIHEKQTVVQELRGRWGILLHDGSLELVFERVATWPRNTLFIAITEHCAGWEEETRRETFKAILNTIASDNNVSMAEFHFLNRIGEALSLSVQEIDEVGLMPGQGAKAEVLGQVPLQEGQALRLGRSIQMEICLPRAPIASMQAHLALKGDKIEISNVGREATLVYQGAPVADTIYISPGEEIRIGRYLLQVATDSRSVSIVQKGSATSILAQDVGLMIPSLGSSRPILQGISFRAEAGELIAIVGPSGCGKSTLLNLISGNSAVSRGSLQLDGVGIAPGVDAVTRRISFVPQDDLLYSRLTVEETVAVSAQLKGLGQRNLLDCENLVDEILDKLNLKAGDVYRSRIGDALTRGISGGQRKRVSVAQELVGDDTDVLLLDEPTSGLDPKNKENVFAMLRDIADSGKLVMMTTHGLNSENISQFDKIICLSAQGQCAYFGRPDHLLEVLEVKAFAEIFEVLECWRPEKGGTETVGEITTALGASSRHTVKRPLSFPLQLWVLVARQIKVRLRDPTSLLLAFLLPLVVVLTLRAIYLPECIESSSLFVLSLASLWTGTSLTIRDLIFDLPIVRHEIRSRTTIVASYSSKVIVAALFTVIQAAILTLTLFPALNVLNVGEFSGWGFSLDSMGGANIIDAANLMSPSLLFFVLLAAHMSGNALGLFLSSIFRTANAAIFTMPLVLLPLIASGGSLVEPRNLPEWLGPAEKVNPLAWIYRGILSTSATVCVPFASSSENWRDNTESREIICEDVGFRTYTPPVMDSANLKKSSPFIRSTSSCVRNNYVLMGEFYDTIGLQSEEPRGLDPADRLQIDSFRGAMLALLFIVMALHAGALVSLFWRL